MYRLVSLFLSCTLQQMSCSPADYFEDSEPSPAEGRPRSGDSKCELMSSAKLAPSEEGQLLPTLGRQCYTALMRSGIDSVLPSAVGSVAFKGPPKRPTHITEADRTAADIRYMLSCASLILP